MIPPGIDPAPTHRGKTQSPPRGRRLRFPSPQGAGIPLISYQRATSSNLSASGAEKVPVAVKVSANAAAKGGATVVKSRK